MSRYDGLNVEWYDCCCMDPEHSLRFVYDSENDLEEVSIEVHLAPRRWYVRIWHALRHVFGYRSRYGDFGSWSLHRGDIERLLEMTQKLKDRMKDEGNNQDDRLGTDHVGGGPDTDCDGGL